MSPNNNLWDLATELLSPGQIQTLDILSTALEFDLEALVALDEDLGGPSMTRLSCRNSGRYDVADREIFRPLQYCHQHFAVGARTGDLEWQARTIVKESGLHLESLVRRIGKLGPVPLGPALNDARVRHKVDVVTWRRIDRFRTSYNAAKHEVSHPMDTHLFKVCDAMVAYLVTRQLGNTLYPLARLMTDLSVFEQPCS